MRQRERTASRAVLWPHTQPHSLSEGCEVPVQARPGTRGLLVPLTSLILTSFPYPTHDRLHADRHVAIQNPVILPAWLPLAVCDIAPCRWRVAAVAEIQPRTTLFNATRGLSVARKPPGGYISRDASAEATGTCHSLLPFCSLTRSQQPHRQPTPMGRIIEPILSSIPELIVKIQR